MPIKMNAEDPVMIVKRIKKPKEIDAYVYRGESKNSHLKKKDFAEDDINEVHFVNHSIYLDDNVKVVSSKVADALNVKASEVFLFYKKEITKDNFMYVVDAFVRSAFRESPLIRVVELNKYIHMMFRLKRHFKAQYPIPWVNDTDLVRRQNAVEQIGLKMSKFVGKHLYVPISFGMYDSKRFEVCFSVNPFGALCNTDDVLHKKNVSIESSDLRDLISFSGDIRDELFVVCRDDLQEYANERMPVKKDEVLDLYFPYFDDKSERDISYKSFDAIKTYVNEYDVTAQLDNAHTRIVTAKIQSNVISERTYDVLQVFNAFSATERVPFVILKKRDGTQVYRILKTNIHKVVDFEQFKGWVEREYEREWRDNSKDAIVFKFVFDRLNTATFIFRSDGYFQARFAVDRGDHSYATINTYIQKINSLLDKQSVIPHIRPNVNCKLQEFVTSTSIVTKSPILTRAKFNDRINKSMFFSLIKSVDNDTFLLKYKRVSNYSNMDNVTMFINEKYTTDLPDEVMVESLMGEFQLSQKEAVEVWNDKKKSLHLHMALFQNEKGKMALRAKHNSGIIVKVELKNKLQVKVDISKLENHQYHTNIIQSLLVTLLSKDTRIALNSANVDKLDKVYTDSESETTDVDLFDDLFNAKRKDDDAEDDDDDIQSVDSIDIGTYNVDSLDPRTYNVDSIAASPVVNTNAELSTQNVQTFDFLNTQKESQVETMLKPDEYKGIQQFDEKDPSKENVDYKRYVTWSINDRLRKADPKLFYKKYSSHCQAQDKKQPVVITKEQKEKIDATRADSYSGFINHGTTTDRKAKNYYICPLVWCPISKTSITYDEYIANNKTCPDPYNETPIVLINKKEMDKYQKTGTLKKYPYYMGQNKHPDFEKMICCGSKPKDASFDRSSSTTNGPSLKPNAEGTKYNDERYVMKLIGQRVPDDRLATLPSYLNDFMNEGKTLEDCSGSKNEKTEGCFLRRGLGQNVKQFFLNMLVKTLHIEDVNNVKQLIALIRKRLQLHEYLFLNSGNTMKTFVPPDATSNYGAFRKAFLEDEAYIEAMCLEDVEAFVKEHATIPFDNSYMNLVVQREMMIRSSFDNFLKYLQDDTVVKTIDDMVDMIQFKWLNPLNAYYIFIDTTDENDIRLLCNKYREPETIHPTDKVQLVLKHDEIYEHVIRLENNANTFLPFNSKEKSVRDFVNIYKTNCKTIRDEIGNRVYEALSGTHDDIDYVINYNLKLVGFFIRSKAVYCPLPTDENMNQLPDGVRVRFFDALPKSKTKKFEELASIHAFYEELPKVTFDMEKDYLKVFVGYQEKAYDNAEVEKRKAYERFVKQTVCSLPLHTIQKIGLIRHELNPYPRSEKIGDIEALLTSGKNEHDDGFITALATDLYNQGHAYVLKSTNALLVNDDERIYYTQFDELAEVLNHYSQSVNPYKHIENSVEDLVTYSTIKNVEWKQAAPTKHVDRSPFPENKIYDTLTPNMMVVDMPLEKAFLFVHPQLNEKVFRKETIRALCEHYTTRENKANIRQVLNYFNVNNVVQFESKVSDPAKDIFIANKDMFGSLITDKRYRMGIYESLHLASRMGIGLVLFTRNKSNPKKPIHMRVVNHMKVLLKNEETNKYMFIYANDKTEHHVRLVCFVNPYDPNDLSFVHTMSDPKVFKKESKAKLTKSFAKPDLGAGLELVISKTI